MMHRLITWKRGVVDPQTNTVAALAVGQAWELDSVGNWDDWVKSAAGQPDVVEQREHSDLHALTGRLIDQGQPTVLAYDANGNQTDDGEQFLFEYDANDKLQRVRNRGDNAVVAEYRYDVFGRRVQKEVMAGNPKNAPAGVTRYYYTGQRSAEERDGDDEVIAFYTYGGYIDEPLTMDRVTPSPCQGEGGGEGEGEGEPSFARHYFHHNRMFSTYALTDEQGAVAERYTYEAYGKVTTVDANYANPQEVSRVGNPFTFTGRQLDPETGLMDYRGRTYGPVEGRFKQTDPIGPADGPNLYEYALSASTLYTDPTGESVFITSRPKGSPNLVLPAETFLKAAIDAFFELCPCVSISDMGLNEQRWLVARNQTSRREILPVRQLGYEPLDFGNYEECCECWRKHSAGCQVLTELFDRPKEVVIGQLASERPHHYDWGRVAGEGDWRALSVIWWNSRWQGPGVSVLKQPSSVHLGHELYHAYDHIRPTRENADIVRTRKRWHYGVPQPTGDVYDLPGMEQRAVRFENQLRRELHPDLVRSTQLRDSYAMPARHRIPHDIPIFVPDYDKPIVLPMADENIEQRCGRHRE